MAAGPESTSGEEDSSPEPARARRGGGRRARARRRGGATGPENAPPQEQVAEAPAEGGAAAACAVSALMKGARDHAAQEMIDGPPELRVKLYPYQQAGLAWMVRRERGGDADADGPLGGLLADEMGLGKTIQILALSVTHAQTLSAAPVGASVGTLRGSRASLGTLIICPLMLVKQWEREIKSRLGEPYNANVYVHHGKDRLRSPTRLAAYDFVLTTYAVVRSERAAGGGDGGAGALFGLRWWRVVLDEAHNIKNGASAQAKGCCELRAIHRWCVTGTPLQNSPDDLFPLLKFLGYPSFGESLPVFRALTHHKEGAEQLQVLLRSLMLRRRKRDTFGGRPILASLPPRRVRIESRELTQAEREVYVGLETRARIEFNRFLAAGGVQANYVHVLALLQRLRQACNSPLLVAKAFEEVKKEDRHVPQPTLGRAKAMGASGGAADECPICIEPIAIDCGSITSCARLPIWQSASLFGDHLPHSAGVVTRTASSASRSTCTARPPTPRAAAPRARSAAPA